MPTYDGRCACGEVRYRLATAPIFVNACHCTYCQRETGSGFVVNALIEPDRVETLAGEPVPVPVPSASGRGQVIWRCPTCQVAVWSNYGGRGDRLRAVRVGTLERPAELPPNAYVFTSTKLPHVHLDPGIPAFEQYYDRRELYDDASNARLEAAFSRRA